MLFSLILCDGSLLESCCLFAMTDIHRSGWMPMWRCMFKGLVEDTGRCSALSKIYLDTVAEVAEVAVEKDTLAALLTLMWVKKIKKMDR